MKWIQHCCAVLSLMAVSAIPVSAAHLEQAITFSASVAYVQTNTPVPPAIESSSTKNLEVKTADIVRALAVDLDRTNLIGGSLLRRVDANGAERIIIRKGTEIPVDVSAFFLGTYRNNFGTFSNVQVLDAVINTNRLRTNATASFSLHTLALNTANLSFGTFGYGTSTVVRVRLPGMTNALAIDILSARVTGEVRVNADLIPGKTNIGAITGPARGQFSTQFPVTRTNDLVETPVF